MLIIFGQMNVFANGLSCSSGSKVEVDNIIVKSLGEELRFVPAEYFLYQNYLNPINPGTTIQYDFQVYTNVQ